MRPKKAVGAASSEVDKAEDAGEAETAEESDEKVAIAQSAKESAAGEATAPITGPAPISHAEGKVPANKRPKSEELKTPWWTVVRSPARQERPVPMRFWP